MKRYLNYKGTFQEKCQEFFGNKFKLSLPVGRIRKKKRAVIRAISIFRKHSLIIREDLDILILQESTFDEYCKIVYPQLIFNSANFNKLNEHKIDLVRYFLFKDNKIRFGLCIGQKGKLLFCPFSAPFASFVQIKENWKIIQLEEAVCCLNDLGKKEHWEKIKFILPPSFYNEKLITIIQNILLRNGYFIKYQDLNYQFDLKKVFWENFLQKLPSNGRKNLNISLSSGLKIKHCDSLDEKEKAYKIIATNRANKGYPIKMSFEQVKKTIELVEHDFFIVSKNFDEIAAAQIFYITSKIAQVIYWGDILGYSNFKPINFLAYQLILYYSKKGFDFLDIGPSTEFGIPNYGLCDFKFSIGCDVSAKMTFEKIF